MSIRPDPACKRSTRARDRRRGRRSVTLVDALLREGYAKVTWRLIDLVESTQ